MMKKLAYNIHELMSFLEVLDSVKQRNMGRMELVLNSVTWKYEQDGISFEASDLQG